MEWNITGGRPVYIQLVEQLELALVNGTFPPGSRIPAVRELAAYTYIYSPTRCSAHCRSWKAAACCKPSARRGALSLPSPSACKRCGANGPPRWPPNFYAR